jgi:hypothetical protein
MASAWIGQDHALELPLFVDPKGWTGGTFHRVSRKLLQRRLDHFIHRFDRDW